MIVSILFIILISLLSLYILIYKNIEMYFIFIFIILSIIGFINRVLLYYLHDTSNLVSYLNILLFVPLIYFLIIKFKYLKKHKLNIFIFIFIFILFLQLFNFYFDNLFTVKSKLYSISTYFILLLLILFPYVYKIRFVKLTRYWFKFYYPTFIFISFYALNQYILGPLSIDSFWMGNVNFSILGLPKPFLIKVFSTTASPGHYASLNLVVYIISLVSLANKLNNKKALLMLLLSIVGTIITGVRSVLFLEILFFIFYFIVYKKNIFNLYFYIASFIATIPFLYYIQNIDITYILKRLKSYEQVLSGNDYSLNARLNMYNKVIDYIFNNPLGYGFGTSGKFTIGEFINIDNNYLEMAFQFSIFALIFFLFYMTILIIQIISKRKLTQYRLINKEVAILSIISILGLMLFGNFLQIYTIQFLFLFISIFLSKRNLK